MYTEMDKKNILVTIMGYYMMSAYTSFKTLNANWWWMLLILDFILRIV